MFATGGYHGLSGKAIPLSEERAIVPRWRSRSSTKNVGCLGAHRPVNLCLTEGSPAQYNLQGRTRSGAIDVKQAFFDRKRSIVGAEDPEAPIR
jgi:hypothetical protein